MISDYVCIFIVCINNLKDSLVFSSFSLFCSSNDYSFFKLGNKT